MILNLVVIVFVLGMAVMGGTYGLFASLLHLGLVITAGALAFALWEPLAYGVFMGVAPSLAWGVSLVGGFAVLLLVFRVVLDKFVPGNLKLPRLADQLGGGAAGAFSGLLTAGLVVLGLSYLPLPVSIAGYQPYEVQARGNVAPRDGGGLWTNADGLAADLFGRLSGGAFSSSTPLASYVPDLRRRATEHRLARQYDENVSLVAQPADITPTVTAVFRGDQLPGIDPAFAANLLTAIGSDRMVSVGVNFAKASGSATWDSDGILRLPPVSVRLATRQRGSLGDWAEPVGFSKVVDGTRRTFFPATSNQILATSSVAPQELIWHFLVPADREPDFLLVRNTRVNLSEPQSPEPADYATLVGNPAEGGGALAAASSEIVRSGGTAVDAEPSTFSGHKAVYLEDNAALPTTVSKNNAQFLQSDENAVTGGRGTAQPGGARSRNLSLSSIFVAEGLRPLRVELEPVRAQNTLAAIGQAAQNVSNTQEIWLQDSNGRKHYPFAWVLQKDDGRQIFRVESSGELRNNTDLPLSDFQAGDRLFAYWRLPAGVTLTGYHVGPAVQSFSYPVN